MKGIVFAVLALALTAGCAAVRSRVPDALPPNSGEVVFTRQESEGSLNILESTITCGGWARVVITGGEAGSVYLQEDDYDFQAISPEPYQHESFDYTCKSAVLRVTVRNGDRVYVEVFPESADNPKDFRWLLKRANEITAANARKRLGSGVRPLDHLHAP